MPWWQPLLFASAFGGVAGLLHVGAVLVKRHALGEFTWTSRDLAWMSPTGNIALLLGPAFLLILLRVIRPSLVSWGVSAGVLAMIAGVSALLNLRGLHPYAVVLLALGIGVQLGRSAAARPGWWSACIPRVIVTCAFLATAATLAGVRRQAPAAAGTSPDGAPNVLVLILDTVRAVSTSLHGYSRSTTPALERLAAEGVRFDWAIAPSPWTLPSHAAMFTGQPGSHTSASWRTPLDDAYPTVAEVLASNGYVTGAFVGNLFYTHHESGIERGFQDLRDFRRSRLQLIFSTTLGQTPLVDRLLWGDRTPRALRRTAYL